MSISKIILTKKPLKNDKFTYLVRVLEQSYTLHYAFWSRMLFSSLIQKERTMHLKMRMPIYDTHFLLINFVLCCDVLCIHVS